MDAGGAARLRRPRCRRPARRRRAPRRPVAVYLDKSPEAVGALLGVMMADAICVPLDPTGPAPRLAGILKDCEPSMLVSSANKAKRLEALTAEGCELPPVLVTAACRWRCRRRRAASPR